jgi:hypothetical protein
MNSQAENEDTSLILDKYPFCYIVKYSQRKKQQTMRGNRNKGEGGEENGRW